jgi:hypothetical protein
VERETWKTGQGCEKLERASCFPDLTPQSGTPTSPGNIRDIRKVELSSRRCRLTFDLKDAIPKSAHVFATRADGRRKIPAPRRLKSRGKLAAYERWKKINLLAAAYRVACP